MPVVVAAPVNPTPPTGTIGNVPPAFAGGQVGAGSRVGLLGERSTLETPFSTTSYTAKVVQDQQARSVADVLLNDPSVRANVPRYSISDQFLVRGFPIFTGDVLFDGLYGLTGGRRVQIENAERIELLRGPSALLGGISPSGNIGAVINVVPKRAPDIPIFTLTTGFVSRGFGYGQIDAGQRFGAAGEWGIRTNLAYYDGDTPIKGQRDTIPSLSLGTDYRGDAFRLSFDLGYRHETYDRSILPFSVSPGVAIPRAPNARLNVEQRYEYWKTDDAYGLVRAEIDLAPAVTLFGAYGHSSNKEVSLGSAFTLRDRFGNGTAAEIFDSALTSTDTAELGLRAKLDTGPITHQASITADGLFQRSGSTFVFDPTLLPTNIYAPRFYALPASLIAPLSSANTFRQPLQSRNDLTSVALADTMSILDGRAQVTVGLREQGVSNRTYNTTTRALASRYDKSALTPSVAFLLKPTDFVSIYGNYIQGLTRGPIAPGTAINANQTFPPFVADQFEIGVKYERDGLGASASLFRITQQSSFTDPSTRIFSVTGEQRNQGVELLVFGQPLEGVRILGGLDLIDGRLTRTARGLFDGNHAVGVPRTQFNLGAEYDVPGVAGLVLTGRLLATSKQYYDQANTQSIPSWARLDIGARYETRIFDRKVAFRFSIENVTGENYWQSTGRGFLAVGAPRTYLGSATIQF